VIFSGKIWLWGSWDNELITVLISDQAGTTLSTLSWNGRAPDPPYTDVLACGGAYHDVTMVFEHFVSTEAIIVEITNVLDEPVDNESIGFGDLSLDTCSNGYDTISKSCCHAACAGECEGPLESDCINWFDNCDATETTCGDLTYKGYRECGIGDFFYGIYSNALWDPATDMLIFTGKIYPFDSWDNE
jgi:hypothetical protein